MSKCYPFLYWFELFRYVCISCGYCCYNQLYLGNTLLHVTCLSTTNTNMAAPDLDLCSVCDRKIPSHVKMLKCDCCLHYVHRNCTSLYSDDLSHIINHDRNWSCIRCNENNFAFNHIVEDECFFQSLPGNVSQYTYGKMESDKIFIPFELNDDDVLLYPDTGADPDVNFFNQFSHQSRINCKYHLQDSFLKYTAHMKNMKMTVFPRCIWILEAWKLILTCLRLILIP